jgi:CheY-like chemotaxis protein
MCCSFEEIMNNAHPEQNTHSGPVTISQGPQNGPHRGTILVVEDEDFVRDVTCEVLVSAGYEVLRARTTTEALRIFENNRRRIQLLLTDVVLPGRNGRMLARDLRHLHSELKTIFTSGYPENEITRQGVLEQDTFYLAKPFSAQLLLQKVEQVLGEGKTVHGVRPAALATHEILSTCTAELTASRLVQRQD